MVFYKMKTPLLVLLFLISGCISRVVPLKHEYVPATYEKVSQLPKAKVWKNVQDFLSKNGMSARILDSSSGLIKTNVTNMAWTYENKNGILDNPKAWVVVERVIYKNKLLPLTAITGEWDIRLKSTKEDQTYIVINMSSLKYSTPSVPTFQPFLQAGPRSTGVFEQMLYEQIN